MHLPAPLRAAVGIVATAADEVKRLPDRAIELPMLAVSTALQASLRAQQRYARLTARGDEVLGRGRTAEEAPAWATFDEPVSAEQLHRTTLAQEREATAAGGSATDRTDDAGVPDDPMGVDPLVEAAVEPLVGVADGSTADADVQSDTDVAAKPATAEPAAKRTAKAAAGSVARKRAGATEAAAEPAAEPAAAAAKTVAKRASKPATKRTARPAGESAPDAAAAGPAVRRRRTAPKKVSSPRNAAPSAFDRAADSD